MTYFPDTSHRRSKISTTRGAWGKIAGLAESSTLDLCIHIGAEFHGNLNKSCREELTVYFTKELCCKRRRGWNDILFIGTTSAREKKRKRNVSIYIYQLHIWHANIWKLYVLHVYCVEKQKNCTCMALKYCGTQKRVSTVDSCINCVVNAEI